FRCTTKRSSRRRMSVIWCARSMTSSASRAPWFLPGRIVVLTTSWAFCEGESLAGRGLVEAFRSSGVRLKRPRVCVERARLRWREPVGWEKYARLFRLIEGLNGWRSTRDLLEEAGLDNDPRGGIGGLHVASALGLCHARSGGRRSLVWSSGSRPAGER